MLSESFSLRSRSLALATAAVFDPAGDKLFEIPEALRAQLCPMFHKAIAGLKGPIGKGAQRSVGHDESLIFFLRCDLLAK